MLEKFKSVSTLAGVLVALVSVSCQQNRPGVYSSNLASNPSYPYYNYYPYNTYPSYYWPTWNGWSNWPYAREITWSSSISGSARAFAANALSGEYTFTNNNAQLDPRRELSFTVQSDSDNRLYVVNPTTNTKTPFEFVRAGTIGKSSDDAEKAEEPTKTAFMLRSEPFSLNNHSVVLESALTVDSLGVFSPDESKMALIPAEAQIPLGSKAADGAVPMTALAVGSDIGLLK